MCTALVLLALLASGQNMNLASDGTTTCVSTPNHSRRTCE